MAQAHSGIIDNSRAQAQATRPADTTFECGDCCRHIQDYWNELASAGRLPSFRDFNPARVPPHILPNLVLLEPRRDPESSRWRFWMRLVGTALVDTYKREITGRYLDEVYIAEDYDDAARQFDVLMETGRPTCMWSATRTHDGAYMNYERLLLPFAGKDGEIDMILSSVEFFPADHWFDARLQRQPPFKDRLTVR